MGVVGGAPRIIIKEALSEQAQDTKIGQATPKLESDVCCGHESRVMWSLKEHAFKPRSKTATVSWISHSTRSTTHYLITPPNQFLLLRFLHRRFSSSI